MPSSGVIPSPPDPRDYPVSAIVAPTALPGSVRLDNKILSIRDQGFWPTCVGKAGASIMSAGLKKELATIPIYKLCKEQDGIPHLPGTYPRTAMKVMHQYGACLHTNLPYSRMADPMPPLTAAVVREAANHRIKTYARARSVRDIQQALAAGHLVMGVLQVGENFMFAKGERVIGPPTGDRYGYHAIVVCGYSAIEQALRIANSWGIGWGDKGFAWLSYDVLSQDMHWPEAWVVEVERAQTAEEFYPDRIFRDLRRIKKNS